MSWRIKLVLALMSCGFLSINAQNSNVSPYSRYGIGDVLPYSSSAFGLMGGASVALSETDLLNVENPATYMYLQRYRPVLEIDFGGRTYNLKTAQSSRTDNAYSIKKIALGLPITKNMGLSFGIAPFSTVGYSIQSSSSADSTLGEVKYKYDGDGGLNKIHIGLGYRLKSTEKLTVGIGANANFIFGTLNNFARVEFPSDSLYYNTKITNTKSMNGFFVNVGTSVKYRLSYTEDADKKLKDEQYLTFGANYSLGTDLNASFNSLTEIYDNRFVNLERVLDTLSSSSIEDGKVKLPSSYTFGLAYQMNKKLLVSTSYKVQEWSSYKETFAGINGFDTLNNSTSLSFGLAYTPKDRLDHNNNLFARTTYRVGVRNAQTNLTINNTKIKDFGISFGLSLPIINSATYSILSLGAELGTRGTIDNNLIEENYVNVFVGITVMPRKGDRWFYKRKYD